MALIKCPECRREISDKAPACIHCGFPMDITNVKEQKKEAPNMDAQIQNIQSNFNTFMSNPDLYGKDMGNIYSGIKSQIDSIYNNASGCDDNIIREVNDKVASIILDITNKGSYYCSWITYKNFYEFVKFDNISISVIKNIADFIYEKISFFKQYSDGSSGNSEHIMLWYPIHQILTYATEDVKKPILENLSLLNASGKKRFGDVQEMINEHLYENTAIEMMQIKTATPTPNIPKCPTCQSTDIKKVSTMSKAGSVALWGLFSQKVKKQWHCNNCGSEW